MDRACKEVPGVKALTDANAKKAACQTIREDGAYIEAGENDNLIVQKLEANPTALGIFGYSFLEQNIDKLQGSTIQGVDADLREHRRRQVPDRAVALFLRQERACRRRPGHPRVHRRVHQRAAIGEDGYLADKGLIPLPEDESASRCAAARQLHAAVDVMLTRAPPARCAERRLARERSASSMPPVVADRRWSSRSRPISWPAGARSRSAGGRRPSCILPGYYASYAALLAAGPALGAAGRVWRMLEPAVLRSSS